MPRGPFLPSEFIATEFSTAADKADFGNAFLHFIESEWRETLFTKTFYNRLSNTFGHIAHYNRPTFYSTWFTSDADRLRFLEQALEWPCWGDAAFTFCDVERALQREIRKQLRRAVRTESSRVFVPPRWRSWNALKRSIARHRHSTPKPRLTQ